MRISYCSFGDGFLMFQAYSNLVTRSPKLILAAMLIVVSFFGYFAKDIKLDNNFAVLFATGNESADFREYFRSVFGPDDALLVSIIDAESSSPKELENLIHSISSKLSEIPDYSRVDSITETSVVFSDDDTVYIEPAFGEGKSFQGDFKEKIRAVWDSSLGGSRLLSEDGRYFVITAELIEAHDTYEEVVEPSELFKTVVTETIATSGLDVEAYFAGVAFTRVSAIDQMQGDLMLLAPVTTLVLAILLFYIFRDIRIVFITQLSIGAAIVVTAGVIRLFDDNINQLTIVYPVLLMVVVTANSLHILHRYFAELEKLSDPKEAIKVAVRNTVKACWLSSMTTAVGFASLMFADMYILHTFGLYLAIGVVVGFFIVTSFIPSMLLIISIKDPKREHHGFLSKATTEGLITGISNFVRQRNKALMLNIGSLCGFGLLVLSVQNLTYDYSLSGMLLKEDPIAIGNKIVDEKLSGIVPIEISVQGEEGVFKSPEALRVLEQISTWLMERYQLDAPKSLASVIRELNFKYTGDNSIPDSQDAVAQLLFLAESAPDGSIQQLVTDDYSHTRIRSGAVDHGAVYTVNLQKAFDAYKLTVIPKDLPLTIEMTGEAPVAYNGMIHLSEELFESVLLALGVITLAILVVFRDPVLTVASLVPNVLPIALGLFVYKLTNDVLDPLPGIAFCIAIGIAVDDTVHLIAKYKELDKEKGLDGAEKLRLALMGVVHPLINSTVILSLGFLVLGLSSFHWNQLLGILGAFMIFCALLCDIFLTPAVIAYFHKGETAEKPVAAPVRQ